MAEILIETPNEKQRSFLLARQKYVAFGGARGGGKSWAVRTKAKLLCLRYPGIRVLIVRRTYPELVNNHITLLRAELSGCAKYSDRDKVFTFFCGSTLHFMYCACDGDLDHLQGVQYDVIFIDEATQLSEFQMRSLTACLRGVNSFPKRVYYTCNPGGQGHGYIKRLFIDRRFTEGEDPDEYVFIKSLVTDNTALMRAQPDYIKQLAALPPKLRDAWLYGKWDVYEGQFFEEFADIPAHYADRVGTHVIAPFDIPRDWQIYRSFDFGYARPFSCAWWAVDDAGVLYRILEMYGCTDTPNEGVKWTPDRIFSSIADTEKNHPWLKGRKITGVADPSIWDSSRGESISDAAARNGVFFFPGNNARIPGWMQVHYRLAFDENGYPMMYVFSCCRAFIRTVPLMRYDTCRPEDLDTSAEDHVSDEVRYMCMARPIRPRGEGKSVVPPRSDAEIYLDIDKTGITPAMKKPRMEIIDEE